MGVAHAIPRLGRRSTSIDYTPISNFAPEINVVYRERTIIRVLPIMASFIILTDHKVLLLAFALLCLVVFRRVQRVKQVWKAPGNLPVIFIFVSPTSIFGRLLPRIPWISPGVSFNWRNAYERQPLLRVWFP